MEKMLVHLFQVFSPQGGPTFESVLTDIASAPIAVRTREIGIGGNEVRLEEAEAPSRRSQYWRLDFIRFRNGQGPGRAARAQQMQGIALGPGEVFAEEVAALYDPSRQYLTVQHHPMGIRASGIAEYLSNYINSPQHSFYAVPVLDPEVSAKLLNKSVFRKLRFSVAPAKLTPAMRRQNVSLRQALMATRQLMPETLTLELGLGHVREGGLNQDGVHRWIDTLLQWHNTDDKAVTKLQIVGKEDQGGVAETLDLLSGRLKAEFDNLPLDVHRRVPRQDRWIRLEAAYNGWLRDL